MSRRSVPSLSRIILVSSSVYVFPACRIYFSPYALAIAFLEEPIVCHFKRLTPLQRIFSTLLRYNRLPLPRLKNYSGLSDRQLHYGLAAMIQHRLVFHYTAYDDGITYYEANIQFSYYLVRSGKILEFIKERLGDYASAVMSTIMLLGHAQIGYLEDLPELNTHHSISNGVTGEDDMDGEYGDLKEAEDPEGQDDEEGQVNGVNGDHAPSGPSGLLHPTLKTLAAHGYITRVREAHFQSYSDNVLDAERAVKSRPDVKQLKGKKLEETVLEKTNDLIRERTDGDLTNGLVFNGVPRGAKRMHGTESDGPNKKSRLNYDSVDGDEDIEENEWSDDEMVGDVIPMQVSLL